MNRWLRRHWHDWAELYGFLIAMAAIIGFITFVLVSCIDFKQEFIRECAERRQLEACIEDAEKLYP